MRQPILYAEEMWRKQRLWVFFLLAVGLAMTGYLFFWLHRADSNTLVWLLYVPSGLLLLGALQFYRWRHRVHVADDGLHVANLLRSAVIPYADIRGVRVQPLSGHYEGRKRLVNPVTRALLDKPALYVRLRSDEAALRGLSRKLGVRLILDSTIALPVPDPDAFAWELNSRLPLKDQVNLGGAKRRKRRR